jgi:peroxiredoxin
MSKSYGAWNENYGAPSRVVLIVDKDGIIRFRQDYPPPNLPDPADILAEVEKLG